MMEAQFGGPSFSTTPAAGAFGAFGAAAAGLPLSSYELPPSNSPSSMSPITERKMRKRKAESQDNERLSKRLSLLNLEQNGQKLYVPVESPHLRPTEANSLKQIPESDEMELDNSKHKVYIYDLDAELSDSGDSDDGRLVFLPDIQKHLRQSRIPPSILANKDGELAGMQVVLYSEPTSLTVPEEQDSVRKAIIESRARLRQKQKEGTMNGEASHSSSGANLPPRTPNGLNNLANDPPSQANGVSSMSSVGPAEYDPDAMDMD
ncbi:hypothetical protein PG995_003491 [Apiospora arundinis]|uniref:Uncharacterized protein n=1 Tax=Apiospora arundinis TaxID=335852 RepID=A0ABR2HS78_9PEZI